MVTKIIELEKIKPKNPIFIQGLPGVGNVGRIAAGYLVDELNAKKFAELWSSHFLPIVLLHDQANVHLLKNEFYWIKRKKNDLIILIGDSQSSTPEGHYEICSTILDYLKKLKVKEIITLAGLSIGEKVEEPKVYGAVNDEALIKKYLKYGIKFDSQKVGTVIGAAGLILGLAKYYKIKGICLLGETIGYPVLPDPKSAKAVLQIVSKILDLKINLEKIDERVREMEEFLKRMQIVESKAVEQFMKSVKKEEKPTYIG
jgi:uncharacterized protein (TIGR00162 family)